MKSSFIRNKFRKSKWGKISLRAKIFLVFFLITFITLSTVSIFFWQRANHALKEELKKKLLAIATTGALLIDADKHEMLTKREDENSDAYVEIRNKLKAIKSANPDIRFVYTMRKSNKPGTWLFVVDAEENPKNLSHINDEFNVTPYPEMMKAFDGPSVDNDISPDPWGVHISAYSPIYDKKGDSVAILGVDMTANKMAQELSIFKKNAVIIFLFGLLFSTILSMSISKRLTRPIEKLTDGMKRISAGDLDFIVKIENKDEIGKLAQTFDEMRIKIKESRTELSLWAEELEKRVMDRTQELQHHMEKLYLLNQIGAAITQSLDLGVMIDIALGKLLHLMRIDAAAIRLIDENTGELPLFVHKGLPERIVDELGRLKKGEGISGKTIETGKTIVIEDIDNEKELFIWTVFSQHFKSMISIPLISKEKILGVLNVMTSDKRKFMEHEVSLLTTIGNQLGVAIENASLFEKITVTNSELEKTLKKLYLANKKIRELSLTDELTKLPNYRHFVQKISEEAMKTKRYNQQFVLALIDLDSFKDFNDRFGHDAGNEALCCVAKILKSSFRVVDFPARFGGEEFAVIMPSISKNAEIPLERFRKAIEKTNFINSEDEKIRLTVSIGFGYFPHDAKSTDLLITLVDKALYNAKNSGKNRIISISEIKKGHE